MLMETEVTIVWAYGLHVRSAVMLARVLQKYTSDVRIKKNDISSNARSVLQMLTLGAQCNDKVTITVDGDDANLVLEDLQKFFANKEEPYY